MSGRDVRTVDSNAMVPFKERARSRALPVAAALFLVPASGVAQQPAATEIVIVTATADDPRIALVEEAIAFWKQTFTDLELAPILTGAEVRVAPPDLRRLETFANRISHTAGRMVAGGPEPTPELVALDAQVVLLLSVQDLMPFAWKLPQTSRFFVAIKSNPEVSDRILRNVIAHELGHVLGLTHERNATTLMCSPCQYTAPEVENVDFLSVTERDRARLVGWYGDADR